MREIDSTEQWILLSLCLAILLSSLGTSIVNVGLPALVKAFGSDFASVQWVVLAYLLTVTSLVVSAGRLGDIVGHRRLLLFGIALFTLASGLCGLTPTLPLLVAARAVQGLGAAIMMALALAFARDVVPKERTGRAMGLLGAMSSVGTTLGPALGGLLVASMGWRSIFLLNVPLGVLTLILTYRTLPAGPNTVSGKRARFDVAGTALLAPSLAIYALAMTVGRGHFGELEIGLLGTAIGGLILFFLVESRIENPLIRPALLVDPVLGTGFVTSAAVATVMMATLVVGPFYLARAIGLNPWAVGLAMAAGPLVAAITALPAGWMADRFGPARTACGGLAVLAVGTMLFATLASACSVTGYLGAIVVVSAGYGFFQTANNTAVMDAATASQRGLVSGVLNLSRNFGLISGASAMGAIFAGFVGAADMVTATPAVVARAVAATFVVAAVICLCGLALSILTLRAVRNAEVQP